MATDFTVADTLARARALVERGWCQKHYAEDANGQPVSDCSPGAVSFCVTGAINRVCKGDFSAWEAATRAFEQAVGRWGTAWNDRPDRTQAEVIAAFHRAEQIVRGETVPSKWTKLDAYLTERVTA